jgi:hypothetical protein
MRLCSSSSCSLNRKSTCSQGRQPSGSCALHGGALAKHLHILSADKCSSSTRCQSSCWSEGAMSAGVGQKCLSKWTLPCGCVYCSFPRASEPSDSEASEHSIQTPSYRFYRVIWSGCGLLVLRRGEQGRLAWQPIPTQEMPAPPLDLTHWHRNWRVQVIAPSRVRWSYGHAKGEESAASESNVGGCHVHESDPGKYQQGLKPCACS